MLFTWNTVIDGDLSLTSTSSSNHYFALFAGSPIDRNYSTSDIKFWSNALTDTAMIAQIASRPSTFQKNAYLRQ